MVASVIFFVGTFGVLSLMTQWLQAVGRLRKDVPTAGMVAAMVFGHADEGVAEGMVSDTFGDFYPGFRYTQSITKITNSMYEVHVIITKDGKFTSELSTYLYSSAKQKKP